MWDEITLISAWISNHKLSIVWDKITYPFPNFNGCSAEVWERISNFIMHLGDYLSMLGLKFNHVSKKDHWTKWPTFLYDISTAFFREIEFKILLLSFWFEYIKSKRHHVIIWTSIEINIYDAILLIAHYATMSLGQDHTNQVIIRILHMMW